MHKFVCPVALSLVALITAGCPADAEDVRPPADAFYFPTGLAVSPDESRLFVLSANSDLRYASGAVVVVDLDQVDEVVASWVGTGQVPAGRDCTPDLNIPFTLVCDETEFTIPEASVRLGNFATELEVQELSSGNWRLFSAVRGDPSVTWVDYDVANDNLDCGGAGNHPVCDDDHRLSMLGGDAELGRLIEEPFGIHVDSANGYALVTHLSTGAVTLVDAPVDGAAPVLADTMISIFAADPNSGIRGAVGVAGRLPGSVDDLVYVTSRSESRVQMLSVVRPDAAGLPKLAIGDFFFLNKVAPSLDARSIVFGEGGNRAYVINRSPPLVHVVDTTLGTDGRPKNQFIGGIELCREASNLAVVPTPRGERLFVACFRDGQVWVIDPVGQVVESVVNVGRGPNGIIGVPSRNKLFVTNFVEDTVVVIDLTPGSSAENRAILRMGRAR